MISEQKLVSAAAVLARHNPQAWGSFLEAIQARVGEAMDSLVASENGYLEINQGRAQAYSALYRTLKDCVQKQAQIEGSGR
jgi:hypothetical protein